MELELIFILSENILNTAIPQNIINGKADLLSSNCSMPHLDLNIMPKTNVYTESINSGCIKLQINPNTDPLYREDIFLIINWEKRLLLSSIVLIQMYGFNNFIIVILFDD